MGKHTPVQPGAISITESGIVLDSNGHRVVVRGFTELGAFHPGESVAKANDARLVACWNSMLGIESPAEFVAALRQAMSQQAAWRNNEMSDYEFANVMSNVLDMLPKDSPHA